MELSSFGQTANEQANQYIIHHGAVITMEKKKEANRTGYAMGENGDSSLLR